MICEYCGKELPQKEIKIGNKIQKIEGVCSCEQKQKAIQEAYKKQEEAKKESERIRIKEQKDKANLKARQQLFTFDNFDPTGCEKEFKACQRYNPRLSDGLIIIGSVGTGKTYLACAILNQFIEEKGNGVFYNFSEYISDLKDSMYDKKKNPKEKCKNGRLLILDDIGVTPLSEYEKEQLFLLVNDRYETLRPIIVTTNLSLTNFVNEVGERTADRLKEICDYVTLNVDSKRMRGGYKWKSEKKM